MNLNSAASIESDLSVSYLLKMILDIGGRLPSSVPARPDSTIPGTALMPIMGGRGPIGITPAISRCETAKKELSGSIFAATDKTDNSLPGILHYCCEQNERLSDSNYVSECSKKNAHSSTALCKSPVSGLKL